MEYRLYFDTYPAPQDWGNTMEHVPLNITEEVTIDDETGDLITGYRADVVKRVNKPLTVDNIVQGAVDEDFTDEQQKYIMRHFSNDSDALVAKYKKLVAFVTKSAKDGGYK